MPFISIWHVAIYDIERMPDATRVFRQVFRWFVSGLGILLLGASLIVHPILPLLTPDSYGNAADLVALILLGFFFFSLQFQFEVPALLTKQSGLLVPGNVLGVIVNIGGNVALIPILGVWGAGWVGVFTYAACSFTILLLSRNAMKIAYPWTSSICVVAGLCATYLLTWNFVFPKIAQIAQIATTIGLCVVWALALFGADAIRLWSSRRAEINSETVPVTTTIPDRTEVCLNL
jgi:O-antigen/teichoic acid export membrane protein